jgi:hypothetical protein
VKTQNGAKPKKNAPCDVARKMAQRRQRIVKVQPLAIRPPTESSRALASSACGLSASERAALKVFDDYRIALGKMFCFTGPLLEKHKTSLALLIAKNMVVKEHFAGGYSLTPAGFRAMIEVARFGARKS